MVGETGVIQPLHRDGLRPDIPVRPIHELEPIVEHVVGTEELPPDPDGPGGGCHVDGEVLLDLVDDLESLAAFPVHLVAECEDREIAQAADLEELLGLAFDPLGAVNHHDGGVNGGQRAVGVFRKVAVARGVDEIEPKAVEFKRHGRRRYGNAAVLFHLHEVGPRPTGFALGTDLARHLDRASVEKEFLRQRRLSRIGMGDDCKRAAPGDLRRQVRQIRGSVQHGLRDTGAGAGREERTALHRIDTCATTRTLTEHSCGRG